MQTGNWLAKPVKVTCILYLDSDQKDNDGTVWWWSNNAMHEHDVKGMTTKIVEATPREKGWAAVKVLALDSSGSYVWAGHDDGYVTNASIRKYQIIMGNCFECIASIALCSYYVVLVLPYVSIACIASYGTLAGSVVLMNAL